MSKEIRESLSAILLGIALIVWTAAFLFVLFVIGVLTVRPKNLTDITAASCNGHGGEAAVKVHENSLEFKTWVSITCKDGTFVTVTP